MTVTIEAKNGTVLVTGEVEFANVTGLRKLGRSFIAKGDKVVFDLSGLVSKDSSGLALLTSWTRFAKLQQKEILFIKPPKQLVDMIKLCSLENILPIESS